MKRKVYTPMRFLRESHNKTSVVLIHCNACHTELIRVITRTLVMFAFESIYQLFIKCTIPDFCIITIVLSVAATYCTF